MSSFDTFNLPQALNSAIAKMNFTVPTEIQAKTIPLAMAGRDLIASAQTGSGKTASFGIPVVNKLLNNPESKALILAPTRELAGQIADVLNDLTLSASNMRPVVLIGGVGIHPQRRNLRNKPRIIIATPGRLVDHLSENPQMLKSVGILVLDEADRMLDMGFAPQLSQIRRALAPERQTLLFSATYPSDIQELAREWLKNPERIEVGSVVKPVDKIDQQTIEVEESKKFTTLLEQIQSRQGSVLVFTRTKRRADKVTYSLLDSGIQATMLHGGRSQAQRDRALQGFQSGKFQVLVATDIAARGIDVPHIEHVVNYDLPFVAEDYLHRIGRTARAGRSGQALCLIAPPERSLWKSIVRLMERRTGRSSREQREDSQNNRSAIKQSDRAEGGFNRDRDSRGSGPRSDRPFKRPARGNGGGYRTERDHHRGSRSSRSNNAGYAARRDNRDSSEKPFRHEQRAKINTSTETTSASSSNAGRPRPASNQGYHSQRDNRNSNHSYERSESGNREFRGRGRSHRPSRSGSSYSQAQTD